MPAVVIGIFPAVFLIAPAVGGRWSATRRALILPPNAITHFRSAPRRARRNGCDATSLVAVDRLGNHAHALRRRLSKLQLVPRLRRTGRRLRQLRRRPSG